MLLNAGQSLALLLVCLVTFNQALLFGRKQKYAVKGRVTCQSNPKDAANVRVYLYDENPIRDSVIAKGKTDKQGNFQLSGSHKEMTRIDPKLEIYHDCNDAKPCKRQWKLKLPKKYINGATYDMGAINLEMKLPKEGRKCLTTG